MSREMRMRENCIDINWKGMEKIILLFEVRNILSIGDI